MKHLALLSVLSVAAFTPTFFAPALQAQQPSINSPPGGGRGGQAPAIPGSFTILIIGK
jgi:hypothetical protein